jgi:hypothetical protein
MVRIRTFIGLFVAAALALVIATPASVSAQTPAPAAQTPSQPPEKAQMLKSPVEGELVSVDTTAKRITVKPATGADLTFTYTETTEISGAQKDAAGLATAKDAQVTVHFTEDAKTKARTATRIVVQK